MEQTATVFQLVYASAATRPFTTAQLEQLLRRAREKNASLGVSGMLLYHEGSFIQALEGDRATVEALYQRISGDERHTNAILLFRGEVEERSFADWTMGFHRLGATSLKALPGLNRFLQTGFADLTESESERIRRILLGFREGRWRRQVDA